MFIAGAEALMKENRTFCVMTTAIKSTKNQRFTYSFAAQVEPTPHSETHTLHVFDSSASTWNLQRTYKAFLPQCSLTLDKTIL